MVLIDNDGFLTALTKFFQNSKTSGSIYLTMKKYNGRTKPVTKKKGTASEHADENLCLIRANNGKKKISTVVSSKEVTRFQMAYGNLLKAHIDGLRKREKKGLKEPRTKQKKRTAQQ